MDNDTKKINSIDEKIEDVKSLVDTASQMPEERLEEIVEDMASGTPGKTIIFDIHVSGTQNFFWEMYKRLENLDQSEVDMEGLYNVADAVIKYYLGNETIREFSRLDLVNNRTFNRTDPHHISASERWSGDLMRDLGFFEKAARLYANALNTAGSFYEGARDHAKKEIRKLISLYRQSDQSLGSLDRLEKNERNDIVDNCREEVQYRIMNLAKWSPASYWDMPIIKDQEKLKEMGYDEQEREQTLQSVYRTAAQAMINDSEKNPKFWGFWDKDLIDCAQKSGDPDFSTDAEYKCLKGMESQYKSEIAETSNPDTEKMYRNRLNEVQKRLSSMGE
ncbi:MAG: hypothetical protein ACQER9_04725 [Nanobdellota archaeon]